jgi:hypothetical protein
MHDLPHSPPDGLPPDQNRSSGIKIPSKRTSSSDSNTVTTCGCCCDGCNCCTSCFCRGTVPISNSNQQAYKGQGTSIDELSDNCFALNASSLEAKEPKPIGFAAPSLELLREQNPHTPAQLAEYRNQKYIEELNEAPDRFFLSERSMTSDATEMSGFFGPPDMEASSMENHPGNSGTQSMLSSFMSAMSERSTAASAIVQHAGAAFNGVRPAPRNQGNPYLRLL